MPRQNQREHLRCFTGPLLLTCSLPCNSLVEASGQRHRLQEGRQHSQ